MTGNCVSCAERRGAATLVSGNGGAMKPAGNNTLMIV